LINALGMHGVGEVAAEELASQYQDLDALAAADPAQIEAIEGFGPNTAESIKAWFAVPRNVQMIAKLKEYGVWPVAQQQNTNISSSFAGKRFVVTGTLPTFSRDAVKEFIKARGGKVSDSVSAKTDYLVAGENAGSKLDNAKALGVTVISEADLIAMSEGKLL